MKSTGKRRLPPRVYPQSNYQGWEITKIRILLQRNNAATPLTMHYCHIRACEMGKNVRLHKVFDVGNLKGFLAAKERQSRTVGRFSRIPCCVSRRLGTDHARSAWFERPDFLLSAEICAVEHKKIFLICSRKKAVRRQRTAFLHRSQHVARCCNETRTSRLRALQIANILRRFRGRRRPHRVDRATAPRLAPRHTYRIPHGVS